MFTCSPQDKIIVEFIKMTGSKVYMHLILNIVLLPEWSTAVCLFSDSRSWVPCLSWTVKLSAVLQKNPSAPTNYLFFCICVYLNPFQQWLYDFEIHLFTPRTTEGLIYNYYRRFKHSLMLQKEKPCIKSQGVKTFEQNEDMYVFLVLPKSHIFFI